ncbi:multiple inositol polyphosphate phosphatase 1-like [Scylla paramamosain]|uniref:multiple inositol polyphosphate phosphatase 1-like n=1 Tax=Scylla paramamosain TaxID=85552 RepID=UPI0030832EC6
MEESTNHLIHRLLWRKRPLGMWWLLVSLLFLGFIMARPRNSQPYCFTNDTDRYHQFATKTPYNYSRGHFSSLDLVPDGCVAVQAWHLIRHGTRYPDKDDTEHFVLELPGMQTSVLKAHEKGQGELCEGDLSLLSGWSLGIINTSWASILAPEGELEMEGLASRYKVALPSLFDQQFSNDSFKFRHTASQRTKASATAYSKGLFDDASIYIPPALDPDPLLKFYDMCEKYKVEVEDNPAARREGHLFWEGPEVGKVSCCMMRVAFTRRGSQHNLPLGVFAFTPHDLQVLEYYYDLEEYYTAGFGHNINTAMACPPLQDVYQHFSNAVWRGQGPRGIFYFTHSKAVISVMSRLGLYRDRAPLTHRHMNPRRLWRTSQHGSFATNLAFTLSICNQNRWWVSVATSEQMAALEGCEGPRGCSWEEFTQLLSGSQHCDLDVICAVTPSGSGSPAEGKGWEGMPMQILLSILLASDMFL